MDPTPAEPTPSQPADTGSKIEPPATDVVDQATDADDQATDVVDQATDAGDQATQTGGPTTSPVPVPGTLWVVLLSLSACVASLIQVALKRPDQGFFVLTLTFAVCGAAVFLDVATRSIPNILTYPAILLGLVLNVAVSPVLDTAGATSAVSWLGGPSWSNALVGFAVCTVFAMISFAMRGLGGGDAKLVMAVGALIGLSQATAAIFHALLIAAVLGLMNWAARGTLIPRLQVVTQNLLAALFSDTRFRDAYPFSKSEAPFALSLFLGLVLAQFIRLHALLVDSVIGAG